MTHDDLDSIVDPKELGKLLLTENLKALLRRIRSGEATAADMNVARAACKDLGVEMLPTPGNPLGQLQQAVTHNLPFPEAGLPN